jgi:hypothetical protein
MTTKSVIGYDVRFEDAGPVLTGRAGDGHEEN